MTTEIQETGVTPGDNLLVFPFGEPESVLLANPVDYTGVSLVSGSYYTPPVSMNGLARLMRAGATHAGCIHFKTNLLTRDYIHNTVLSTAELKLAAIDYGATGNCYFQATRNGLGKIVKLARVPAVIMRRRPKGRFGYLDSHGQLVEFQDGEIIHLKEPDPEQSIYGVPQWIGASNDILLNEAATLFRRKHYNNGAHMGFILVMTDPTMSSADEAEIANKVAQSKGLGNFKSMFINIPDRNKKADDVMKLIPIGELKTQSDWDKVKDTTRDAILTGHRVPPVLAGMAPELAAPLGDFDKIMRNFYLNEIRPLQIVFEGLNPYLSGVRVGFKDVSIDAGA